MYEIISKYINEEFGLLGTIILFVIILLVPILNATVLKLFEIQFYTNWLLKNKNKLWIRIFRNDKSISMCLNEYRQLMKSSNRPFTLLFFYLGFLIGFVLPISILSLINHFDYSIYALLLSNLILSLIPFTLTLNLSNRAKVIKHDLELEFKKFLDLFSLVISISLFFAAYFLIFIYSSFLVLIDININIPELEFYFASLINMATSFVMFFSILKLFSSRKRFLHLIQTLFNKKWFKKFPNICIITFGGVQIDGRVNDAFNTDYIILNKNGNQIITLWSSVASIEFLTR